MTEEKENGSHVLQTKKQIAERNKNNQAINSHVTTLKNDMLGLVIVYKNGTYDKHIVNFSRQSYVTVVDENKNIVKYKNRIFRLVPVETQGE